MKLWPAACFIGGMSSQAKLSVIFILLTAPIFPAQAERDLSVYEIKPAIDGPIIGVTAIAASLAYLSSDRWIHRRCPCDPNEVNAFDRSAIGNSNATLDTLSDITLGAAIFGPPILDFIDLGFSREFKQDMWVYVETFSVNSFFTTFAKYTAERPLTRTYAGDPALVNSPGGYRSFYSGHTSTVFSALSTAAVTLNLRYHQGGWPWLVVAGLGASVGVERVAAGRHFPTDVMVGAVAGTAVGLLVPYWHQKGDGGGLMVTAAPIDDGAIIFAKLGF